MKSTKWSRIERVCEAIAAMAGPATHCWIEHTGDVLAGERPDNPATPAQQRIGGKHGSEVYACVSGPDSHAWIELLASSSESDVAHQETIRDMAAATARVWKQVSALQAMAGTIRLALKPSETVELVFDALVRATRFRGGIAIVQLPGEPTFAKLDAAGFSPVADEQLALLHEMSEEVRALDKKRDANDSLYLACLALMAPFEPTAVARLESPHGTLGYVLAVSDERPSSDDLKLLTGAAHAIATHLDNAHELVRLGGRAAESPVAANVDVEDERTLSAREIATNFDGVLGGIVDSAELALGDAASPEEVRTSLDRLLDGVKWARTMARNLLVAARDETPRRVYQDLGPHIATALDMFSGSLPAEIELHTAIETDACKVVADAAQISQAIVSLCNNSREAIGQRKGRIYVLVDPVELGIRDAARLAPSAAPGRYLRVAVSDTGPGVPETIRAQVFEPFVSTKAARAALGMGLTVVKEVADAHGGYVRLSEAPEGGAQFEIYLPQAEEPAHAPASKRPTESMRERARAAADGPPLAAEPADDEAVAVETGSDLVPIAGQGTSLSRGGAYEAEIIPAASMKAWNPMAVGAAGRAGSTASIANESRAAALAGPGGGEGGSTGSALVPTRPFAVAERRAGGAQRTSAVLSGDKPPENWAGTPSSPRSRSGQAAVGYERGGVIDVLAWSRAEVAAIDKPGAKDAGALPKPKTSKSRTSGGYAPSDDVVDGSLDDAG